MRRSTWMFLSLFALAPLAIPTAARADPSAERQVSVRTAALEFSNATDIPMGITHGFDRKLTLPTNLDLSDRASREVLVQAIEAVGLAAHLDDDVLLIGEHEAQIQRALTRSPELDGIWASTVLFEMDTGEVPVDEVARFLSLTFGREFSATGDATVSYSVGPAPAGEALQFIDLVFRSGGARLSVAAN